MGITKSVSYSKSDKMITMMMTRTDDSSKGGRNTSILIFVWSQLSRQFELVKS